MVQTLNKMLRLLFQFWVDMKTKFQYDISAIDKRTRIDPLPPPLRKTNSFLIRHPSVVVPSQMIPDSCVDDCSLRGTNLFVILPALFPILPIRVLTIGPYSSGDKFVCDPVVVFDMSPLFSMCPIRTRVIFVCDPPTVVSDTSNPPSSFGERIRVCSDRALLFPMHK